MPAPDDMLLDFPSVPKTRDVMDQCIAAIDLQLDEMEERKVRLQVTRSALAALTGKNRDDTSPIKQAMNGADRSQYEGDEDRRVPRKVVPDLDTPRIRESF